jgi:nucleoside-diphosphate-sugar epimerase
MTAKSIAPGSLILVTGANGFIGSHIVVQLLEMGYRVRGTARDASKLELVREILSERNLLAKFEGVVVPDMAADEAFNRVIDGKCLLVPM